MARYSSRRGPNPAFDLLVTEETIPGLTITRHWDEGELLILGQASINNNSAADRNYYIAIRVDGAGAGSAYGLIHNANGEGLACHACLKITKGEHTISLNAKGTGNPIERINIGAATLTVIQLPIWDQDTDIIEY